MFYGCWSPVWLSARHFSNSPALTPMHSYVVLGFSQYPASCFSISAVNHCVFLKSCCYTKYRRLLENKHSQSFPLRFHEFKAYFIYTHICKCFYLLEQSLNLITQVYAIYLLTKLLHFEDRYNALLFLIHATTVSLFAEQSINIDFLNVSLLSRFSAT